MTKIKITTTEHSVQGNIERRKALGITEAALAHEAGLTTQQVVDQEATAGSSTYDLGVAVKITSALARLENPGI